MALGHWVAIGIVAFSIIILVGGLLYVIKQASPALDQLQDLQQLLDDKSQFFQAEIDLISQKIDDQAKQGQAIADQAKIEKEKFDHLSKESKQLANQIGYIQNLRGDVMNSALDQGKDYIQNDLPRQLNKLKLIAQKTTDKQKKRYS